jgi:RNA polymerase sigma-70 factor (ECF subfamily)
LFIQLLALLTNRKTAEEEIELIRRIVSKDQNALARLYDLYSRLLYSLIFRIVKNREDAEELLQTVFLQVWDKADSFDLKKGSVYSWLITLARNKSIDKIRSKTYKEQSQLSRNEMEFEKVHNIETNLDIGYMMDEKERVKIVSKALNELPAEQKQVIELSYYEGLTQMEISQSLNVPLGTVKTRTRQALIKLENLLAEIL